MRWWLILCLFGYATKAIPTVVDKALFHTKAVKNPVTYAVAVSLLGGLVLLLAPFFLTWPSWHIVIYALGSGATFTLGTLLFFAALKYSDASRVTPFIGAAVALITAALAYLSLDERLPIKEVISFILLVTGGFLVTRCRVQGQGLKGRAITEALLAALFFAVQVVLSKAAFDRMPGEFLSAIIWMRFGSLITALILLAFNRGVWRELQGTNDNGLSGRAKWAFLGGQSSGAVSGLLIYGAIALGTPTLINAMTGLEYLFVVIFSVIVAKYMPQFVKERFTRKTLPGLIVSLLLIGTGLVLLAF